MPMWFWHISRPETATPPAFAALPGPNSTLLFWNTSTAAGSVGMFAPSATQMTPFLTRASASCLLTSFWVAQGKAMSHLYFQGLSFSWYSHLNLVVHSLMRPRLTFLRSMTNSHPSLVSPFGMVMVPSESDRVTTFAPSCIAFSAAYCATFPLPEMATFLPLNDSPLVLSISTAKYTQP